jgi:prevent-host-death family protein
LICEICEQRRFIPRKKKTLSFSENLRTGSAAAQYPRLAGEKRYIFSMTVTTKIENGNLAELVKQVEAGNEVLLTQGDKPVARLVPARETEAGSNAPFRVRSIAGHRVVTPVISQEELAAELFDRQ